MENADISGIADSDSCEEVRGFFCEFSCAEYTDCISFELPVSVSFQFVYERMVLLSMVFANRENFFPGTDDREKIGFKRKDHQMFGFLIINMDQNKEIAAYYKVVPVGKLWDIHGWIMRCCVVDIVHKGYINSNKQNDRLKYRLEVMAY